VNCPPGKDLTMSLKMRAGMTTRPSSSTSAGDDVWIEISMSVADNFSVSPSASRRIPPSNWMVDLADTPTRDQLQFSAKRFCVANSPHTPPFTPYYYYLNHIFIRIIIIIRPVDMWITAEKHFT
jgi:hypothetical protein